MRLPLSGQGVESMPINASVDRIYEKSVFCLPSFLAILERLYHVIVRRQPETGCLVVPEYP